MKGREKSRSNRSESYTRVNIRHVGTKFGSQPSREGDPYSVGEDERNIVDPGLKSAGSFDGLEPDGQVIDEEEECAAKTQPK